MSSASFPSLELHCGPSAWLRAAVLLLALAAAAAVMLSALPTGLLWAVPVLAALGWRSAGRGRGWELRFGADGSLVLVGTAGSGRTVELLDVAERGPLLVVSVRTGARRGQRRRTLRLCFGPDTAPAPQRRALRLWQQCHGGAADPALAALGLR